MQQAGGRRVVRGMPSTVIRRFDYLPASRELIVEFVTGRRYAYQDVPPGEAEAMRSAYAKGIYFNRRIRDRYEWRELSRAGSGEEEAGGA